MIELHISLAIGILALSSSIVSHILVIAKIKWETEKQAIDITRNATDINNMGSKINSIREAYADDLRSLSDKMIEVITTLRHVQETISKIEEKIGD